MHPIQSFVVRIYRRTARDAAGVVEDVSTGRSIAFRDLAELCTAVLRLARKRSPKPAEPPAHG